MALELEKGFLSAHPGIYEFDKAYEPADNELEEFEKHFPLKKKRKSLPGDF